ncbi:MAG TPA: pyridoxamine 5'-phosphate oxidase family protein [Syntrophales bacterium]|nr:pyridoxamine 5'-phosphate oxidase family protein [Syntrophales bacterium]HPQ44103.1 pyridoxamine 5'-phosphate oxidase family protein [Syntrophales bacterium]
MSLSEYFEKRVGTGVLSTADGSGKVNAAIYGRPHFIDDQTIAFIMADRLTHANLTENSSAIYLFREAGEGYMGRRLYLTRTGETEDLKVIEDIRSRPRHGNHTKGSHDKKYLVYFHIDRILPLIGDTI